MMLFSRQNWTMSHDDEEVAGEAELLDERQFVFELRADFLVRRVAVAVARAGKGLLAQKAVQAIAPARSG